jgi:hypothetical protein
MFLNIQKQHVRVNNNKTFLIINESIICDLNIVNTTLIYYTK